MNIAADPPHTPLSQLTIIVPFETAPEHRRQLEQAGARVIVCPQTNIEAPDDYSAMDEAIENLYGYDWLIFVQSHAAAFFLERFQKLGHETSELDSLRVCALGESTVELLEDRSVHIDVIPERFAAEAVVAALANYSGGAGSLRGLNFLLPQAAIGRDYLKDDLADAGARADVVAAYRTVAAHDAGLPRLRTLMLNGGIDCVIFRDTADVNDFASLFDFNDLSRLLSNVTVACLDDESHAAAGRLGAPVLFKPGTEFFQSIILAIAARFSS
ncbi:MAG TPA: uroporphyrinogen-III synthase [Pyrinomonadaceae bacterium]